MPSDDERRGIGNQLDELPFGRTHLLIVALTALGLFIDIAELSLNASFATLFGDQLTFVSKDTQAYVLGSVFIGGIIGAPLFGVIADRYGRRAAMLVSMALVAICSVAAAFAQTATMLICFRFLSGIALGAYPPLMTAWLTDILPPRLRARLILTADAAGFLGAPAIMFAVYRLTLSQPQLGDGWRLALAAGGAVAAVCAIGFLIVPESPRWLAARGRLAEAQAPVRRLGGQIALPSHTRTKPVTGAPRQVANGDGLLSPALRRPFLVILSLYALRAVPTVVFPILMGLVLRSKGIDLSTSLLLTATSSFGGTLGTLLSATLVDRIDRRGGIIICGLLLIVTGTVFFLSNEVPMLLASLLLFLTFGAVYGPLLSIYAAEIVPTIVRARATAIAWGLTRAVSSFLPIGLLPLLTHSGVGAFMVVVTGSIALSLVIIGVFGPIQRAASSAN